jgi:RimJ/RimL family protein N-acetyltransferase
MSDASRVILVPFTREHVDLTFQWVIDPEFQRLFLMRGGPTREKHKAYFENVLNDGTQRVYAVLCEGCHVGNGGIKNIILGREEGELWVYVGLSAMRGKGIGKHATGLLIREAFENLKLLSVYVHVAKFNDDALKMYAGLGFTQFAGRDIPEEWRDRQHEIVRMRLQRTL